ncbi:MAG: PAS domain-containing sensor histidine kinase, partial [Brevundimonas sp.]
MRDAVSISPPDASKPDHEALLSAMPAGIILLDLELRVLWANPYVEALSGYDLATLTDGRRLTQLTSLAGRIYLESQFQMEMAGAGRAEELAIDLVTPTGLRVRALINAVRTRVAGEERILVTVIQAAARRAYEEEVPKARQAAAEAESVKSDFLANISHEIRTPLNGISGVSGALAQTELNARQQEMVALIQSSSQTLTRLVSDILEISRVEAGSLTLEPVSVDLQSALASVVEAARLRAETKGLRFHSRLSGLDVLVLADATRLKQVLGNLLDNALKFTAAGSITVVIRFDRSRAQLNLRVSDTGIGFDASETDALFEKFVQADTSITRRFGGSGVGLSIVKGLVQLMGGGVSATSEPGRGSRFT